jgi:hypothetical protein
MVTKYNCDESDVEQMQRLIKKGDFVEVCDNSSKKSYKMNGTVQRQSGPWVYVADDTDGSVYRAHITCIFGVNKNA